MQDILWTILSYGNIINADDVQRASDVLNIKLPNYLTEWPANKKEHPFWHYWLLNTDIVSSLVVVNDIKHSLNGALVIEADSKSPAIYINGNRKPNYLAEAYLTDDNIAAFISDIYQEIRPYSTDFNEMPIYEWSRKSVPRIHLLFKEYIENGYSDNEFKHMQIATVDDLDPIFVRAPYAQTILDKLYFIGPLLNAIMSDIDYEHINDSIIEVIDTLKHKFILSLFRP